MSQQALNLRTSIQAVRKHRLLFLIVVLLGLLIGAGYAAVKPPMLSSTALVVLPQAATPQSASSGVTGPTNTASNDIATQMVIGDSEAVLAASLPHISPPMSLQALQNDVKVASVTSNILSFSASGRDGVQAEAVANAVANSYVGYVTAPHSPVGRTVATILQPATSATGSKLPERLAIFGLLGALGGALVGFVISIAIGRSGRRLTERDEIANSIGAPVLAAIPVRRPTDAASWAKLLDDYEPGVVSAWALTRLLQQLGVAEIRGSKFDANNGGRAGGSSLTIMSLASDRKALALGPQLAAFAASLGIPTALIIGPQQDMNVTATLRTACAAPPQSTAGRRKPLRLVASDDGFLDGLRMAFVVVVTVVDDRSPSMPETVRTAATVLGVSAGAATAEQLARAATAAAADGREILGLLVANPDPTDQTTGRIPQLAPGMPRPLPTRVHDTPRRANGERSGADGNLAVPGER